MMKVVKYFLLLALLGGLGAAGSAQSHRLHGRVRDNNGPLAGATIWVYGTRNGVQSDAHGVFSLQMPSGDTLSVCIAYMGYRTERVSYRGQSHIDVILQEQSTQIGAAVVVGRANINDLDIRRRTGSVAQVNIQRLQAKPMANLALAMQGNLPGIAVRNRGEVGEKPEIRVRGTSSLRRGDLPNEPLYVVDGKVVSPETFFNLSPDDLRAVKLLKDAVATALYGIKAANGVLEVSTRRGGKGGNAIAYHGRLGVTFPAPRPFQMMNTEQKLALEERIGAGNTPGYIYSEKAIRHLYGFTKTEQEILQMVAEGQEKLDELREHSTDWYSELLRPHFYHSHALSYTGGTEKTSLYLSAAFLDQKAMLEGNGLQRFSANLAVDNQAFSNLALGASVSASYTDSKTENGTDYSPYDAVFRLNPYETRSSKQLWSYPRRSFSDLFNQYSRRARGKQLSASANLNYLPIPELEIAAIAGFDLSMRSGVSIVPPTAYNELHSGIPKPERGKLSESKNSTTNITTNLRVSYSKTLGKHDLTLGANTDSYNTIYDNLGVSGRGIYANAKTAAGIDNSIEGTNRARVFGKRELIRNIGVGALAGYTYNHIYDVFATYKLDASSVLPKRMRYNSAWAVGLGWTLNRYSGIREWDWLKLLKLRASYGHTANLQGVSPSNVVTTFTRQHSGYGGIRALEVMMLPNDDLRAEQNRMLDVGLQCLFPTTSVDISYYHRRTVDALLDVPIPASTGFSMQKRNVGILDNSGVDVSMAQTLFQTENWYSRIRVNMAYNRNRVVDLYEGDKLYIDPESLIPDYEVGQPTDLIYGLHSLGISPTDGAPHYRLHDGQEVGVAYAQFSREDFSVLGHATPPISGSIYLTLRWDRLSLGVDCYYTLLGKMVRRDRYIRDGGNANCNAPVGQRDNMWFEKGDRGKIYPDPWVMNKGYYSLTYPNQRTVLRTDMLRLSAVSLRYDVPVKNSRLHLQALSAAIEAANLYTLTPYSSGDPESGLVVIPLQPILTASLKITF